MDVLKLKSIFYERNKFLTLNDIYNEFKSKYDISQYSDYKAAIRTGLYRNCIGRDLNKTDSKVFIACEKKGEKGQRYGLYEWIEGKINKDLPYLNADKNKEEKQREILNVSDKTAKIEKYAFKDNLSDEIQIPNSVVEIEDYAFMNCSNITEIYLPKSIKKVGKHVFEGCTKLETIFCETREIVNLLNDLPSYIEVVCLI